MNIEQIRSDRYTVQFRTLAHENTTLQSCVDSYYLWLFAVYFFEYFNHPSTEYTVCLVSPCWILIAIDSVCTQHTYQTVQAFL